MKSRKKISPADAFVATLRDQKDVEKFTAARQRLKKHLVHTRDLLNGKDFLFSGPADELHEALKNLVEIEHRRSRFLRVDYAQIEEYFLLRVGGPPDQNHVVESYFD